MREGHARAATTRTTIPATIAACRRARANAGCESCPLPMIFDMVMPLSKGKRALGRDAADGTALVATDKLPLQLERQIVGHERSHTGHTRLRASAREEQSVLSEEGIVGCRIAWKPRDLAAHVGPEDAGVVTELEERGLGIASPARAVVVVLD